MTRVRRSYGAHPLQLVLLLASFALAAYAVQVVGLSALWNPDTWWKSIAVWFVGAALAHDLVLFPVYAAADRVVTTLVARSVRPGRRVSSVPVVNYLRVPLLACGLVTLLFFPGIIRQGADSYTRATGQTQEPFLLRWLMLCAAILLIGLTVYLVARLRSPVVIATSPDSRVVPGTVGVSRPGTAAPAWTLLVVVLLVLARRRALGSRD